MTSTAVGLKEAGRGTMWRLLKPVIGVARNGAQAAPAVACDTLNQHFVTVGRATALTVSPPIRAVPVLLPRVLTCAFQVSPVTIESLMYS